MVKIATLSGIVTALKEDLRSKEEFHRTEQVKKENEKTEFLKKVRVCNVLLAYLFLHTCTYICIYVYMYVCTVCIVCFV